MTATVRVLVVEDERYNQTVLGILLKRWGFVTSEAHNGAEALYAIGQEGEPDVILLDVRMPVMDGYEFLEHYTGSAKIILLSGYSDDYSRKLPKEPYARIPKPFASDELRDLINKAVGAR